MDGSISLWLVDYLSKVEAPSEEGVEEERWGVKLSAVATLTGHQAPLTSLQFTHYTVSLLASGCRSGSVRIWDVEVSRSHNFKKGCALTLEIRMCSEKLYV